MPHRNRFAGRLEPHPSRTQAIKSWHINQAADTTQKPIALLSLYITAAGDIHSTALGIEPAHAQIILRELESVRERLESFASTDSIAPVVPIRRTA
jgi:hypothetical protein